MKQPGRWGLGRRGIVAGVLPLPGAKSVEKGHVASLISHPCIYNAGLTSPLKVGMLR